ncbi:MAG: transcriptional regulator [Bacteroidota bacterium]
MYKDLNPIIHSQLRLAIISYLVTKGNSDFKELKEVCKASSGNLSVQLKKLEEAKYIEITKGFMNNYQHTAVKITQEGILAFEEYVNVIKNYLN